MQRVAVQGRSVGKGGGEWQKPSAAGVLSAKQGGREEGLALAGKVIWGQNVPERGGGGAPGTDGCRGGAQMLRQQSVAATCGGWW